jgi:predicted RNase H-like nuclease (RuvC/YqgF family)
VREVEYPQTSRQDNVNGLKLGLGANSLVDRVYKADIPEKRKTLERLKAEFSKLHSQTDWNKLRVEPLLQHVKQLEQRLKSQGSTRLTKGVRLFHSDLVYLRENVNGLKEILQSEKESLQRGIKTLGRRGR